MISDIQKRIIVRAVKIRLERGEDLEMILESYTKLTEDERHEVRSEVGF